MTANPQCVSVGDAAMEALGLMAERGFRHLPVIDERGVVMGVLDISKCLFDAIMRMERAQRSSDETSRQMHDAVARAGLAWAGAHGAEAAALEQLLGPMVQRVFAPTFHRSANTKSLLESGNANSTSAAFGSRLRLCWPYS